MIYYSLGICVPFYCCFFGLKQFDRIRFSDCTRQAGKRESTVRFVRLSVSEHRRRRFSQLDQTVNGGAYAKCCVCISKGSAACTGFLSSGTAGTLTAA